MKNQAKTALLVMDMQNGIVSRFPVNESLLLPFPVDAWIDTLD